MRYYIINKQSCSYSYQELLKLSEEELSRNSIITCDLATYNSKFKKVFTPNSYYFIPDKLK